MKARLEMVRYWLSAAMGGKNAYEAHCPCGKVHRLPAPKFSTKQFVIVCDACSDQINVTGHAVFGFRLPQCSSRSTAQA